MTLWHRTCRDAAAAIGETGTLTPHRHPIVGASLVWLSDRPDRSRRSLGLTMRLLTCDRMERLYRVDHHPSAVPWLRWAEMHGIRPGLLASGDPRCWWVSEAPVSAVSA